MAGDMRMHIQIPSAPFRDSSLYTSSGGIMELTKKTIGQCLREQAEQMGDHVALEVGGWSCTYRQLDRVSDYLAAHMGRKYGICQGTHVGIWSVNSPNWVFTFFALVKIGAVPILINTCYQQDEMKGILNYSDVEVLYYGAGYKDIIYEDIVAAVRQETPKVRHFIHIDEKEGGTWMEEDSFSARDTAQESLARLEESKQKVRAEDPACMIFTSGTTSLPKGVVLTHYNLVNNSCFIASAMGWGPEDKMCITVPLFHCFGITAGILACLQAGTSMYLIPYFRTAMVWDAIEKSGCTILNGVPSMFLAMIRKPKYKDKRADHLRSGIIAGSPVSRDELTEICRRFPNLRLRPSYGQTETSPCVSIGEWDPAHEPRAVSAGQVNEHVSVRICSPETGEPVETGRDGEIQVKGYNVMTGYYKLPQANAKAFTADGWLKTGDLGHLDERGELFITGRLKEMIIRAGENISPQEIEEVIRQLKWVCSVKVIGVPAEVLQEEIAACIVPVPGCQVDEEGLLRYLKPRLAHYKIPAYVLKFDKFPMNASGKIHLKRLKEMAAEMIRQKKADQGAAKIE